jgi:ribosome-associated heat shock protein Hsp15
MSDAVRLDKWLWAARFFKTRSLAGQAVRGGKVEINGASPKPSRLVRAGDRLRITRGELVFEVTVEHIGERRVSAPMAREMYSETEAGRKAREAQIERLREQRAADGGRPRRPDKRQRRQIRRLIRGND